MTGKLLIGPPRPREPADLWRTACVGVAIMGVAAAVGAYGLGLQHARSEFVEQTHDAEYYRGLAEQCIRAGNALVFDATLAGYLLLDMQKYQREQIDYAELVTAPRHYVAEGP